MIENGDKVIYVGISIPDWSEKKGTVVSDPYTLENAGDIKFADVEWFFETPQNSGFKKEQRGHVVNLDNLKKIK